ncbi:uncharacterized protein TNCV_2691321 [Trichonephila clavipes]|uniref:Uncharacterized protein n=1 Tax=Trichonephila clavipes TaxID=2585209 RepID=A0A8X6VZ28_TRICX|nr:uncharacterized protein TNCV_2691321 [Trichonephila clavipes]
MLKILPFAIHKTLIGVGSELKFTKRLRSGDLLIETTSALQTKSFLLAKSFLNNPVAIRPHKTLNSCRGVISEPDLLITPKKDSPISARGSDIRKHPAPVFWHALDVRLLDIPPLTAGNLLPSTFSAAATSSESQPPVPLVTTTSSTANSVCTSTTSSSSNQALFPSTSAMFTALSTKTHSSALETTTSTSTSIPFSITSYVSQASKQNLKTRGKKRNTKTICNIAAPTVKPKIEIKMASHKPRKSSPIQDTSDEDMIVYAMEEQMESQDDKYFLSVD